MPYSNHCGAAWLRVAQYVCLLSGVTLCSVYFAAQAAGEIGRRADLAEFFADVAEPDRSLWTETRSQEYDASLALVAEDPVAVLRVPTLGLEVPVYPTDSELHLNRGAALIKNMGHPDLGGNTGIAGHRDGFFRTLKDIQVGDLIEVRTSVTTHRYRITATEIVDKDDVRPLADTADPSVTLVTCYPFYFVGKAPQRFVVRGTYEWDRRLASATDIQE